MRKLLRVFGRSTALIAIVLMWASYRPVLAQGPAFTYQGQLKQSGVPLTGTVDLDCSLWDAEAVGNQVGATINLPGVNVANGLFSVALNGGGEFGATAFNGAPRWLAISVNGTPLSPRQALTAAPYALHAAGPWVTNGQDVSYVSGAVGVGTSTPAHPLDVAGDTKLRERLAVGNDAGFGPNQHFPLYSDFDISHVHTDFATSVSWAPFRSYITLDPDIDLPQDSIIYSHDFECWTALYNDHDYSRVLGPYLGAVHEGGGNVAVLVGAGIGAQTFRTGSVDLQIGAFIVSDLGGDGGTGTIQDNHGLEISTGNSGGAGATITNDYSVYVYSPYHSQPMTNHYGIYLEDQDFGVNDSFAIYSAGGKNYLAGNLGIGTSAPQAKLHIGGTSGVDGLMFPDGTLQTTAAAGGGGGLTLAYSGSADVAGPDAAFKVTNTGTGYGLWGQTDTTANFSSGVFGLATDLTARSYGVAGQSNSAEGRGVYGYAPAVTGVTFGGWFESDSTSGTGAYGTATAVTGTTYGVIGGSFSTGGRGVAGYAAADTGNTYGVYGESRSTAGRGVFGLTTATNGNTYAVYGESRSNNGAGVYGISPAASGTTAGGIFESSSTLGVGVSAHVTSATGGTTAGIFRTDSISGLGVLGTASASSGGASGGEFDTNSSGGRGVSGYAFSGTGTTYGVYGQSNSTSGRGVFGWAAASSGSTYGVYGQCQSPSGRAVFGYSTPTGGSGDAVFGQSSGTSGRGTVGYATAASGVAYGMWGQADSTNGRGVFGYAPAGTGLTYGVIGQAGLNGWAVFALGDMAATGLKPFRIDHPSDPENKYLLHYATESPSPQNFYSGNVVTDGSGYAWVELPEYFAAVNANFKYQLTIVDDADSDAFAQVKVSQEIRGNRFQIRTSAPGITVSWRVEADRNDLCVRFKKPKDVVAKEGSERGTYQHPEFYGQPEERGMNYRPEPERPSPPTSSESTSSPAAAAATPR